MPTHIFERVTAAHLRTAVKRPLDVAAFAAYQEQWQGERGQAAYLEKIAQFDEDHTRELEPLLGTIRVPVLVVWGGDDAWLDPGIARRLGELIPHARVQVLPDAGHFVMEDAPEDVAQALATFFEAGASS